MPLLFVYLCDLLDDLEKPHRRRVPLLPKDFDPYMREKTIKWFKAHRNNLNAFNTDGPAVMSMLQPEKQTERVYGLDPEILEMVIARILHLSTSEDLEIQKWKHEPIKGDLGDCVGRVMENKKAVSCFDYSF